MNLLNQIHRNENGSDEGINKLAILLLVAAPLIILLAVFGKEIKDKATEMFKKMMGSGVSAE